MLSFVKILLVLVSFGALISADPVPDTSEKCLSCQTQVNELNSLWSNATS